MLKGETTIRVRYGETDQMGYVYYGFYALYFEVGRVEMLRDLGLTYRDMENGGIMMPVMKMNCEYLRPARYDDLLTIQTTVLELPERDIVFHYEIYNEKRKILNRGTVQLCFVDIETSRRTNCPELLLKTMRTYFE